VKKLKNIISWVLVLVYLVVALSFISAKRKEVACEKVKVHIYDGTKNLFIEEKDVLNMLKRNKINVIGQIIEDVNVNRLEEIIKHHPSVKEADVYRSLTGEIKVGIQQRKPILRVFNNHGESFYIDDEGTAMPLSTKYSAHILVASGNISFTYSRLIAQKREQRGGKVVENSIPQLRDLYQLASYIYNDEFWNAQIEQIYVNSRDIELIPRVGTHVIKLGTMEDYTKKFRNLKALYEQGLPVVGWNNYKTINLKYSNQVICTKR